MAVLSRICLARNPAIESIGRSERRAMKITVLAIAFGATLLAGCASPETTANLSNHVVDAIPAWLGGEPADVPPRRGTPEYDALQAKRAQEAARIKDGTAPAK
jgi:hypothetical protein